MKMIVGFLSLVLSFASIASSGETKTFVYDGSQNSVELLLRGEKTHTEYRYEQRRMTCYRTQVVGYRTSCSGGSRGPRGPRGPGHCTRYPIYRQVAYPCTQTVQIPYEVKDFDVEARVILDVSKLETAETAGETFNVTLFGDELSIATAGSKKFFIMLKKQDLRASINGSVKFIDGLYAMELIEAAPIVKALNLTDISLEDSVLSFKMGPVENRAHIGFSLNVTHKRALASNTVLFNRELTSSEIVLSGWGEGEVTGSSGNVNIEQLGIKLNKGKYSLTAKAFFKAEGTLLNKSQFEDLKTSKTLIYKKR